MTDKKYIYEVRQVEAWAEPDGGWTYNNSWKMGTFTTRAKDHRKAFTGHLRRKFGVIFKKNKTRITFDGDNYEVVDRKTGEPLFCAYLLNW